MVVRIYFFCQFSENNIIELKPSIFYLVIDRTVDHLVDGEECEYECGTEGLFKGAKWCYRNYVSKQWNYCTRDGQECKKKCGTNELHNGRKWCYTVSGSPEWDFCMPCK